MTVPSIAKSPCASCPYRRDAPSGMWHESEYEKLPLYDGETWEQSPNLFLCHQRDGNVCAGWIACHDPHELLALRLQAVDPAVFEYRSPIPVFASGQEACDHGLRDCDAPGPRALRQMRKIEQKRGLK